MLSRSEHSPQTEPPDAVKFPVSNRRYAEERDYGNIDVPAARTRVSKMIENTAVLHERR